MKKEYFEITNFDKKKSFEINFIENIRNYPLSKYNPIKKPIFMIED